MSMNRIEQPPKCDTHGRPMYWNPVANVWACSQCERREQPAQGEPSRCPTCDWPHRRLPANTSSEPDCTDPFHGTAQPSAGEKPRDWADMWAQDFHDTYERLAPRFGYATRPESAKPWSEVPEINKSLMRAVVAEVLVRFLNNTLQKVTK